MQDILHILPRHNSGHKQNQTRISNVAGLVMLMVLYQLVREDFGSEIAERAVLYLAIFPTAFFFAAAYNESLFLCLALLSFYYMRHGQC
jgi:Gpi18-like mannosyltransferase